MFRLARLTTLTLKTPVFRKAATHQARVCIAPTLTWRQNFSQSSSRFSNLPSDTDSEKKTKEEEEEDELEAIDPKDYPELYPAESDEDDEEIDKDWFVDSEYSDEKVLSETDFIPLWQRRAVGDHLEDRLALQEVSKELMESGQLTAETVTKLLEESKMENVHVIDVREKCDWADYMIVASSAKGDKYLGGVAEHVRGVVSYLKGNAKSILF